MPGVNEGGRTQIKKEAEREKDGKKIGQKVYLTPRNCGASPGALVSVSILRESTWPKQRTVAATHHGKPSTEQTPVITPTINMSK
jgi:hypothetical protein